jgi:hypothetical protein
MTLHGHVERGVVVLHNGDTLPEGTLVYVTPVARGAGNPLAVIAAMEAEPHLSAEDVAELQQAIAAGKRPAAPQTSARPDAGIRGVGRAF